MRDYDELVGRLHKRIAATTAGSPIQDDLLDAAGVIEGLSKLTKEQDDAISGEICQVLARYGIYTEPGEILKRLEELDDRSNKRYRDGYLDGYRKALEDQERTEVPR